MTETDIDELRRFLPTIPIFGGINAGTLDRVIGKLQIQDVPAGTKVCREGEPGRSMYILKSGEAVVTRSGAPGVQVKMVRIAPGEFFGELTLIDPQPRSTTVTIEKAARLLVLSNQDLYALYREDLHGYVWILQNLCRELSRRLRRADSRICEIAGAVGDDPEVTQISTFPRAKPRASSP